MRLEDITNRIVSGSATIIAVVAMATAVYQAKLMRDQAKASVWPYPLVGNSGNTGYARIVQNVGLGPAVIRSFEVRVNGRPVRSWKEAADSMGVALGWTGSASTTFGPGIVAPTNATADRSRRRPWLPSPALALIAAAPQSRCGPNKEGP